MCARARVCMRVWHMRASLHGRGGEVVGAPYFMHADAARRLARWWVAGPCFDSAPAWAIASEERLSIQGSGSEASLWVQG